MITLIIQNSFEPYYAGKQRFTAPASAPVEEPSRPDESRKSILTQRQRVQLLQARLAAARPRPDKP